MRFRDRLLVINEIINAKILFALPSDFDFREYIKHWETLRRVKEVDTLGIERYIWESTTGVDHYCFATFFYYIAVSAQGAGQVFGESIGEKRPQLIQNTSKGQIMGDIKQIIEEMALYDGD